MQLGCKRMAAGETKNTDIDRLLRANEKGIDRIIVAIEGLSYDIRSSRPRLHPVDLGNDTCGLDEIGWRQRHRYQEEQARIDRISGTIEKTSNSIVNELRELLKVQRYQDTTEVVSSLRLIALITGFNTLLFLVQLYWR